jgi:TrwC relaxase
MHPLATQRLEQLDALNLTDANVQASDPAGRRSRFMSATSAHSGSWWRSGLPRGSWPAGQLADESVSATDRARIRTDVARDVSEPSLAATDRCPRDRRHIAKQSRPRIQTVAGYDLTCSPVKSVSTLWAVADSHLAAHRPKRLGGRLASRSRCCNLGPASPRQA